MDSACAESTDSPGVWTDTPQAHVAALLAEESHRDDRLGGMVWMSCCRAQMGPAAGSGRSFGWVLKSDALRLSQSASNTRSQPEFGTEPEPEPGAEPEPQSPARFGTAEWNRQARVAALDRSAAAGGSEPEPGPEPDPEPEPEPQRDARGAGVDEKKDEGWYYTDTEGQEQGPFSLSLMRDWYRQGYFQPSLGIKARHASSTESRYTLRRSRPVGEIAAITQAEEEEGGAAPAQAPLASDVMRAAMPAAVAAMRRTREAADAEDLDRPAAAGGSEPEPEPEPGLEPEPELSKAELKQRAKEEKRRAKEEEKAAKKAAKKKGKDRPQPEPGGGDEATAQAAGAGAGGGRLRRLRRGTGQGGAASAFLDGL